MTSNISSSTTTPIELLPTDFAPAERAPIERLRQEIEYFANDALEYRMLDAMPDLFMILNSERQIVYGNRAVFDAFGTSRTKKEYGNRPGEQVQCLHATESVGGCGTTEACRTCGAALAIVFCQDEGEEVTRECRIMREDGSALDLRVRATPLETERGDFVMIALQDISHEKRRQALERIFFHDILNSAGGIQGLADILRDSPVDEVDELVDDIYGLAGQMVGDIRTQQILVVAENGDLEPDIQPVDTHRLLRDVITAYRAYELAEGRYLAIAPDSEDVEIETDPGLAHRVLGNMVKNALEASAPGQTVTIGCRRSGTGVALSVHNETVIPREDQLQIFQRSFSTKGTGRGLGTYGMKLLTERYLDGQVDFSSAEETGTTFTAWLPIELTVPTTG